MADTPETLRQPEADRPATHAVRLSLNGPGLATVEVDGQDHSSAVTGYSLSGSVREHHELILAVRVDVGEVDGQAVTRVPADTAALLLGLGWTPPADNSQPVDLTDPKHHDAVINVIKVEARRDPDWLRTLLRRDARAAGGRGPRLD